MARTIYTESLCKKYGKTSALDDVSFEVPEGAIYALVGANGAGKTTLIKVLMNLIGPTYGRALVLGTNTENIRGRFLERIGYVSENQEMTDWATVEGIFDYFRPFYPSWDKTLEQKLVRQFDLPLKRKLKHLSRGMRMKAAFVSSMAYRPAVIVLDEPLSGLDPFVRDELIQALRDQAAEATILLSSHDLSEIEGFASHVGFLEQGRMLFSEAMPSLMGRFREVTVTLSEKLPTGGEFPSDWLNRETVDGVLRFVHRNFRAEASAAEVRALMPDAAEIRFEAMPLRSIFLAIAKAGRGERQAAREGTAA